MQIELKPSRAELANHARLRTCGLLHIVMMRAAVPFAQHHNWTTGKLLRAFTPRWPIIQLCHRIFSQRVRNYEF